MILTFGNCKAALAPYVDSGKCATDPAVLTSANDAMMRLLLVDDWKLAVQKITFKVTHNTIVLPEFVESIFRLRTCCGVPSRVFDRYYEFCESGTGQTSWNGNPGTDLVDMGKFPTFHPIGINSSLTLCAFSPSVADQGKTLHVRGIAAGREAMTGDATGIELPVNRWMKGIEGSILYDELSASASTLSEITHVVKPVTSGHVTLIAMDQDTKQMQVMAVYQPWETTPEFRRYKVVNHDHENGSILIAACKMRYLPMRSDNDPLIIQNLPAMIAMLQALREEKARNIMVQQAYEQQALGWLRRQAVQLDDHVNTPSIQVNDWGMGDATNFN